MADLDSERTMPFGTKVMWIVFTAFVSAVITFGVQKMLDGTSRGSSPTNRSQSEMNPSPLGETHASALPITSQPTAATTETAPLPPPAQRPDLFGTVVEVREAETTIVIRGQKGEMESVRANRNMLLYRDGTNNWLGLLYNVHIGDDVRVVFQGDSATVKTMYLVRDVRTKPQDAVHTYRPTEPAAPWKNVRVRIVAEYWNEDPKWIEVQTEDAEKFAFYGPRIQNAIYAGGRQKGLGWSAHTFELGDHLELQEMERYRDGYTSKRIYFLSEYPEPEPGSMESYFPGARGASSKPLRKEDKTTTVLHVRREGPITAIGDDYFEVDDRGEKYRISVDSQTPVQSGAQNYRVEHLEIGDVIRVMVREDDGRVASISLVENVRDKKKRPE